MNTPDSEMPDAPRPPLAAPSRRRHAYRAPRLTPPGDTEDLLEVLGPAQASYGGTGFAP